MGYISSYYHQASPRKPTTEPRIRVAFVLSTVHPGFTTLSRGQMFPTSRPAVVPATQTASVPSIAQAAAASVGFVSEEVDWFLFSTWGPSPLRPDWHWAAMTSSPMKGGGDGVIEFGHIERLVLTILESVLPDSDVFGYLTNPNWKHKHEIPIRKLTVQDHQADGLVLYGLDGNGAAIGITLRAYPPSP